MSWRVGWTESAQQQLAQVWLDANDRDSISSAVAKLDRHLQLDPIEFGESRTFVVETRLSLVTVIRVFAPKRQN